jgi:ribosomal protein S18 acetylase RimI-like enzyme
MPSIRRPLRLRPFTLDDASMIESWLEGHGLSVPAGALRRQWPERLLADARIRTSIAEADGCRVGFVRFDCGPDQVAEVTLVVAPGVRRSGCGSAMFAAALHQARRLGLRALVASVDVGNAPALAFFAEQGFVQDGMVGDRVRMRRLVHAGVHAEPLDIG